MLYKKYKKNYRNQIIKTLGGIALISAIIGHSIYLMNDIRKSINYKFNSNLYKVEKEEKIINNDLIEEKIKEIYVFEEKEEEKELYKEEFMKLGIEKNKWNGKITPKGLKKIKQAEIDFEYLYKYSKILKVPFEVVNCVYWSENSLWGERSFTNRYGPMQISKKAVIDSLNYLKIKNKDLYKILEESYKTGKWKKDSETNILAGIAYLAWIRSKAPSNIKKDKLALDMYSIIGYHAGIGLLNNLIKRKDWRVKDFVDYENINWMSLILDKRIRVVDREYIKESFNYLKKHYYN